MRNICILICGGILFFSCKNSGLKEISKAEVEKLYASPESGSQFVNINGTRIHYRDQGQGQVIFAIHGTADSLHVWNQLADELIKTNRVIRFDIPGFGLSDPFHEGGVFSANQMNKLIDELLVYFNITDPIVILGNSLGGYIAWKYAYFRPDRVLKMCLIAPFAYPVKRFPMVVELAGLHLGQYYFQKLKTFAIPKALIKTNVRDAFGDPSLVTPDMVNRYYYMAIRQGNKKSYFDNFREILKMKPNYPFEIAKLKMPIKLIWGSRDRWINPSQVDLWQKDLPLVEVDIIEGAGHTPQLEVPNEVLPVLKKFL